MFGYMLLAVIIAIMGLLMLLKPEIWWSITEKWKSNSADEPSDFYKLSTKIGGAIFTFVGIAGFIYFTYSLIMIFVK